MVLQRRAAGRLAEAREERRGTYEVGEQQRRRRLGGMPTSTLRRRWDVVKVATTTPAGGQADPLARGRAERLPWRASRRRRSPGYPTGQPAERAISATPDHGSRARRSAALRRASPGMPGRPGIAGMPERPSAGPGDWHTPERPARHADLRRLGRAVAQELVAHVPGARVPRGQRPQPPAGLDHPEDRRVVEQPWRRGRAARTARRAGTARGSRAARPGAGGSAVARIGRGGGGTWSKKPPHSS